MKKFDIIVIGSGAGSKITRPAANMGKTVAIIEKGRLGGTCLNHGCIPSKMLIHPADVATTIRHAHRFDIEVDPIKHVNFSNLVTRVNQTIDDESDSIKPLYNNHDNITLYPCHGRFISDYVIDVDGELITADQIFIVTGARAHRPDISGLEMTPYLTYKEALRMTTQPKSMIIIGGGYIAVELGHYFAALGTDVTFVVRSELIRQEDDDVRQEFHRVFSQHHTVYDRWYPTQVKHEGNQFSVQITNSKDVKTLSAEHLFIATGVVPNTDNIGLENTGVKTDSNGFIVVNDRFETDIKGVVAFGDVVGRYLFRHSANFEGEYVFNEHVKQSTHHPVDYPPIPHAIFTYPQVAGVGVTEQELKHRGVDYVVGLNRYESSAMGMALRSDYGFVKVLFDRETRQLVGAHIIGEEASNMIHMCIAFMLMKATVDTMHQMVYVHPALPEVVRNAVRKAIQQFDS